MSRTRRAGRSPSASGLPDHLAGDRLRSQCSELAEILGQSSESGVRRQNRGAPSTRSVGQFASKETTAATFGCSERPSGGGRIRGRQGCLDEAGRSEPNPQLAVRGVGPDSGTFVAIPMISPVGRGSVMIGGATIAKPICRGASAFKIRPGTWTSAGLRVRAGRTLGWRCSAAFEERVAVDRRLDATGAAIEEALRAHVRDRRSLHGLRSNARPVIKNFLSVKCGGIET
jgi:hypothetical protein